MFFNLLHVVFPINKYYQQWKNVGGQTKLSNYNSCGFRVASVAPHEDTTTSTQRHKSDLSC